MKYFFSLLCAVNTKIGNLLKGIKINFREKRRAKKDNYCQIYCVAALLLSLLGWLFPDALWDEYTVSIVDENGQEIAYEYSGEELEEMISGAEQIAYKSKISEFVSGLLAAENKE